MFKKLVLIVVVLVVIVLTAAYFYRNVLVETAVEESGDYVLGVPTDLGSANLDLSGESLSLDNYTIANPEGFEGEHFMVLRHGMIAVNSGSILDDEVVIDSIVLEGFRLSLEQIDRNGNYLTILDNLKRFEIPESSESEQRLKVGKLTLRDIGVDLSATVAGQKLADRSFVVENFSLSNVGGAEGTSAAGLIKTVVSGILGRASSQGAGLPNLDVGSRVDQLKQEGTDKLEEAAKDKLKGLGL